MALLDDISIILAGSGLGTFGTDLFCSQLPPTPDTVVALFETGGLSPLYTHSGTLPAYERPTFQVVVRDASYVAARAKIESIWKTLAAIANTAISGTFYLMIRPRQSPFDMGQDKNERAQLVVNFDVIKAVT